MRNKYNSGHFRCSKCSNSEKIYFDNFLHHFDKSGSVFAYCPDLLNPTYYHPLLVKNKATTEKFIYWNQVYVQCPNCKKMTMEFYDYDLGRKDLFRFENFLIDLENSGLKAFEYRLNNKSYVEYLSENERNYFSPKDEQNYRTMK